MRTLIVLSIGFLFFTILPKPTKAQDCTGPNGNHGVITYNADYGVIQGCTPQGWVGMNPVVCPDGDGCVPDLCAGTPTPGTVCADGTIFAGESPDGNVPMFTTPADAGLFSWNDGTLNWADTAMQNCASDSPGAEASCQTGEANTALLVALGTTPSPAPYVAARHCDNLDAFGHTDWYLPALDELNILYVNLVDQNGDNVPGGPLGSTFGFNVSGSYPAGWYWSSSETVDFFSRYQRFSDGGQGYYGYSKDSALSVRCVRR